MKIRTGFISNSSSSSFIMIGISVDNDDIKKLFEKDEKFGTDDWGLPDAVYHKYDLTVYENGDETFIGDMRYVDEEDTYVTDVSDLNAGNFHLNKILEDLDGNEDCHKVKLITGVTEC